MKIIKKIKEWWNTKNMSDNLMICGFVVSGEIWYVNLDLEDMTPFEALEIISLEANIMREQKNV